MKTIPLKHLQNAEHLALMSDLLVLLKETNLEPLAPLTAEFTKQIELEDLAQKEIIKSSYTAKIIELDQKRDDIYRGLTLRVQSEMFSEDENEKKAAEEIEIVLKTYGNFTKHNLRKETTEIENLLNDLKNEKYTVFAENIGLVKWINWLETANNKFQEAYNLRRDEYADRPELSLRDIRRDSDLLFKEFRKITEALEILQPSEDLKTLVTKADITIEKWRDTLSKRKANAKKEENNTEE